MTLEDAPSEPAIRGAVLAGELREYGAPGSGLRGGPEQDPDGPDGRTEDPRQAGCSVVDRLTNGLWGADDGEHAGEFPGPRPPSGELAFDKRFPYCLAADEYQHEGGRVGRDVCVNVTCGPRVEGQ